jgi:uncharacterized protein (TIGR02598 family)
MARAFNGRKAPGIPGSLRLVFASARSIKRAFTLVEVLIAAGILGFTVVTLYGAFSFGFTTIRLSQEEVRADQILVQKLETLRLYDWSKITGNFLPTNFTNSFSSDGTGVSYYGTFSVTPFAPSAAKESYTDSLCQVTVSLHWVSGAVERTRSMTTQVSKYGIQNYQP